MQLTMQLSTLVAVPASPATPAGDPAPITLVLITQNDPRRVVVSSSVGGGAVRVTTWNKAEALAFGRFLTDFAAGMYD